MRQSAAVNPEAMCTVHGLMKLTQGACSNSMAMASCRRIRYAFVSRCKVSCTGQLQDQEPVAIAMEREAPGLVGFQGLYTALTHIERRDPALVGAWPLRCLGQLACSSSALLQAIDFVEMQTARLAPAAPFLYAVIRTVHMASRLYDGPAASDQGRLYKAGHVLGRALELLRGRLPYECAEDDPLYLPYIRPVGDSMECASRLVELFRKQPQPMGLDALFYPPPDWSFPVQPCLEASIVLPPEYAVSAEAAMESHIHGVLMELDANLMCLLMEPEADIPFELGPAMHHAVFQLSTRKDAEHRGEPFLYNRYAPEIFEGLLRRTDDPVIRKRVRSLLCNTVFVYLNKFFAKKRNWPTMGKVWNAIQSDDLWTDSRSVLGQERPGIEARIEREVTTHPVLVYSKSSCAKCARVKQALAELGVPVEVVELDQLADGAALQAGLLERTGLDSVPQLFVRVIGQPAECAC